MSQIGATVREPSRTSREHHCVPRSTKRTHGVALAGDRTHPFAEPIEQLCAEIEHLKRENRALRAHARASDLDGRQLREFPS